MLQTGVRSISREWIAAQVLTLTLTQHATPLEAVTAALDIGQLFVETARARTADEVAAAAGTVAAGPRDVP